MSRMTGGSAWMRSRSLLLMPFEHSSGTSVRRGGITKAGNVLARRVLIEGAKRLGRRVLVDRI
jgi:transposase